jgi:iron complex outermembrane receptor protein
MRFTISRFLMAASGVAAATALHSTVAFAQTADGGTTLARDAAPDVQGDIVVTAQKREESLNEVPISIAVLSGATLDASSVEGVAEALRTVPGVTTSQYYQGGGTGVTVRGVTANAPTLNGSNPVSYYLDTVPFSFVKSAIAPDSNAFDLQRVEVLRGPQGTLYGASALNGVVRVLTNDANLSATDFKARASTSYTEEGSFNYRADAMVNVPIVEDKLGVRLVAGYTDNDGWLDRPNKDDFNSSKNLSLRAKVGFQPIDDLRIDFSYWLARDSYGGPSVGAEDYTRGTRVPEPMSIDYDALGLKIAYDLGGVTLTNSTGYLTLDNNGIFDYAGTIFNTTLTSEFKTKIFSNEATLSSNGSGSLSWSLGSSYRSARDELIQATDPNFFNYTGIDKSSAYAFFGEATQAIGQLRLTGGLRYFKDNVSARAEVPVAAPVKADFSAVTPRVVLNWLPSQRTTAYLSYSQGFRSGAIQFQGLVPASFPTLKPDRLHNYEAGVKAGLFDNRVQFEGALYYIDWQDVQQSLRIPFNQAVVTALVNGSSASGVGIDAKVSARVTPALTLSVAGNWNDLTLDAPVVSQGFTLFEKGDRLNRSPATTIAGSADYAFSIGDRNAHLSGALNYTSPQEDRTVSGGLLISRGQSQLIGSSRLSVEATDHVRATLYIDNITNQNHFIVGAAGISTRDFDARVRPRTFGIQLEYR